MKKLMARMLAPIDRAAAQRLPPRARIRYLFLRRRREILRLKNPRTFSEKIQWSKFNELHKPIYTMLSDKFAVRAWVKDRIGQEYLIPLYGSYRTFDEIDVDTLPERFVIKCNHDSGSVIVCHDKTSLDIQWSRDLIEDALGRDFGRDLAEPQYQNIPRRVLVEELIGDGTTPLADYKFYCFDGVPAFCGVYNGTAESRESSFFDMEWNLQPFRRADFPTPTILPTRPRNLDKMIEIARRLSEGFGHVRVDLYNVDGRVYFGEMTFTTGAGIGKFAPKSYDRTIGDLWSIGVSTSNHSAGAGSVESIGRTHDSILSNHS